MTTGSQADLIRELQREHGFPEGKPSRTAISKLIKEKDYRITLTPGKRIEIEKSAKALIDSGFGKRSKPIKKKNGTKNSKPGKAATEAEEDIQEYLDGKKPVTLGSPRSIISRYKEFQQAEKERIKNERDMKELVNFNQTSDIVFNFFRSLRDDLLEVAKRVSPLANMAATKHEAKKIISDEITRIIKSKVGDDFNVDDSLKKKLIQILRAQLS
jgi:hypothetical protein